MISALLLLCVLLLIAHMLVDHADEVVAALLMRPAARRQGLPGATTPRRPRIKRHARLIARRFGKSATIWKISARR